MRLPLLVSVPHAGTSMPDEVRPFVRLAQEDVIKDGDEQARELYLPLREQVVHFVTTDIARAFVDLNRPPDDFRKDGVIKTHTCWDVPVYRAPLAEPLISRLLDRYYHPYHGKLRKMALEGGVRVGVDCHTMVAYGPPVGPDPGRPRPAACVSDVGGGCDPAWTHALARELASALGNDVRINDPFRGGYIIREHAAELPWLQLEISRGDFATVDQKALAVRLALKSWSERLRI